MGDLIKGIQMNLNSHAISDCDLSECIIGDYSVQSDLAAILLYQINYYFLVR